MALEAKQVVDLGPPPAVDALVLVADRGQPGDRAVRVENEVLDQFELGRIRVLKLVDEQVAEASPNPLADVRFLSQKPHRERDEIVEVDAARAPQLALIAAVGGGDMAVEEVLGLAFEPGRSQEPVLGRADPALDRAGLERLLVQVLRLQSRLDQPQLIRRVDDREVGREADAVPVAAQQPHAEPVEGADEDSGVAADQVEGARPRISSAALLVKVTAAIRHGSIPFSATSQAIR